MKIAVVAVTKQGIKLAERTAELLFAAGEHNLVIYIPEKFSRSQLGEQWKTYHQPLRELFGELFAEYDGIVCIMALGIVIRLVAPYVKKKTTDPAIVVMDELGKNVISALSGHWGGANSLALQIAEALQANPVITTATDVNGLPAIEVLAQENGWSVEPFELVKKVNADIVHGNKIIIYSEAPLDLEPTENILIEDFARYSPEQLEESRVILVTNLSAGSFPPNILFLRPQNLCIGIGCRRGVSAYEIKVAIMSALEEAGRAIGSVRSLTSVDIKSNETGLLETAEELNLPVEFFTRKAIQALQSIRKDDFAFSEFVNDKIGVGGVCEPVAIMGAGETSKLILPKTKYGKVTIALAEGDWQ